MKTPRAHTMVAKNLLGIVLLSSLFPCHFAFAPSAWADHSTLQALSNLAAEQIRLRQYETALETLEKTASLAEETGQAPFISSVLYRKGIVFKELGQPEGALECYLSAIDLTENSDELLNVLARNNAAEILNGLGRHADALDTLAPAEGSLRALTCDKKNALQARLIANTAISKFRLGEYLDALNRFQAAGALFERDAASTETLVTKLHVANTFTSLGRFREAEELYLDVSREALADANHERYAEALNGLGWLLQYVGRQEDALAVLDEALGSHELRGNTLGAAYVAMTMGGIYTDLKDYGKAEELLKSAVQMYEDLDRTADKGLARAELGLAYLLSGKGNLAKRELERAIETLSSCECPTEAAIAYEIMGRVLLRRHEYQRATTYFERSLRLATAMGRPEAVWRAHAGLGDVYSESGDLNLASAHYLKSLAAIEAVRDGSLQEQARDSYLYDKRRVYDAAIRILLLLNDKYAALESLERRNRWIADTRVSRRLSFESSDRQGFYEQERVLSARVTNAEGRLQRLRSDPAKNVDAVQGAEREVSATRNQRSALLNTMRARDPILYNNLIARAMDIDDLTRRLPENVAIIAYFMDVEDLYSFSLIRGSLHLNHLPKVAGSVRENAGRLRNAVSGPPVEMTGSSSRESFLDASRALYDALVMPLPAPVREKTLWYVLPDEDLWTVAFAALASPKQADVRFLAEDHLIRFVNTLAEIDRRGKETGKTLEAHIAAFGDPQNQLPAAGEEIKLLKHIDPTAQVLAGQEATEAQVRRLASTANILVFSSHANRPPDADDAHVCLAPSRNASADSDGRLTAAEIRSMDLAHVDLVVLAGCGTALSVEQGRTFLSLADAFLFAGARTVLATLWDINDRGTLLFVQRFVEHWRHTGAAAQGFHLAQKECIADRAFNMARASPTARGRYAIVPPADASRDEGVLLDMSHPYYWGPFVLVEYGLRPMHP